MNDSLGLSVLKPSTVRLHTGHPPLICQLTLRHNRIAWLGAHQIGICTVHAPALSFFVRAASASVCPLHHPHRVINTLVSCRPLDITHQRPELGISFSMRKSSTWPNRCMFPQRSTIQPSLPGDGRMARPTI